MTSIFVTVQGRGTLALPADIRRRHGLDRPGAQVQVVERDDGVIELHPRVSVPADQAWFWERRWQEREAEVDRLVSEGAVKAHRSADELLAHLDALDAN